jgi:PIN domain nuclease of toxin-antitoxin system
MSGILLDTCAAIYLAAQAPMRAGAQNAIKAVVNFQSSVYVSPFSAWEIGLLVAKGRINLSKRPEIWFDEFVRQQGIALAALPPSVLIASSFLPGSPPSDPADRVIVATARELGYAVITRDHAILAYAEAGHVNAIEC